jgi:hypothetical protein
MADRDKNKHLAVIVPYRDRPEQLEQFLAHMTGYLPGKVGGFSIWVIEQEAGKDFNRGMLGNIGFLEAKPSCDYICIHDVDILPMTDAADYSCPESPRHIYGHDCGLGAVALFNNRDFEKINGFSNSYWGWGSEDVDLLRRVEARHLEVDRSTLRPRGSPEFTEQEPNMLKKMGSVRKHERAGWQKGWDRNRRVFKKQWKNPDRIDKDGLSTCRYEVLSRDADQSPGTHRLLCRVMKSGWRWW